MRDPCLGVATSGGVPEIHVSNLGFRRSHSDNPGEFKVENLAFFAFAMLWPYALGLTLSVERLEISSRVV